MEDLVVDVKLWGQLVGSLVWDSATSMAVFEYDNTFRRNGIEPSPLTMPLSMGNRPFSFPANRTDCFKGLPGLIADSLPDKFGNQIITEWFARQGLPIGETTPLERLCYVGQRAMGALEFEPSKASDNINYRLTENKTDSHAKTCLPLARRWESVVVQRLLTR